MPSSPQPATPDGASVFLGALNWAAAQGFAALGLLSPKDVADLKAVAMGERAFRSEHYDLLRAFAHACFRAEGAPPINVADALEAIQSGPLRTSPAMEPWPISARPGEREFGRLDYQATSSGIAQIQRENRDGWQMHAEKSRALVSQGLSQFAGVTALVLGAGKAYDIPLKELVHRYDRLLLVDIDLDALTETTRKVLGRIPSHVTLIQQDVGGISNTFVERLEAVFAAPGSEQSHYEGLLDLLGSYRLLEPPPLFPRELTPGGKVDSAYSLMLLSQLATPLTTELRRAFHGRYPNSELYGSSEMQAALNRFTHRVQHDHVRALLLSSDTFVLTTDLAEQLVQLAEDGTAIPISAPLPIVAAERIDELIPQQGIECVHETVVGGEAGTEGGVSQRRLARVLAATAWIWPRVLSKKPGQRGSMMSVQGAAVSCHTFESAAAAG